MAFISPPLRGSGERILLPLSSSKSYDEFGNWQHERVELKPFNKDFDSIIITSEDGEDFRVIGEFVGVIK